MIPLFPVFANLDLSLRTQLDDFAGKFEPYSDFSFTSLYSWNVDNSTRVSQMGQNIVFILPDYLNAEPQYSILGNYCSESHLENLGSVTRYLKLIPESMIKQINTTRHEVYEERESFDYIFNLHDLASMTGGAFKKKRNKLHRVLLDFGERLNVKTFRGLLPKQEVVKLFDGWAHTTGAKATRERLALLRLYDLESLNFVTTVISIDDAVVGFSIHELLPNAFAMCHFEKVLNSINPNLSTLLVNASAKALLELGKTKVNWQQDLGIDGLRRTKLSYRPAGFLKKYTIKL